MTHLLDSNVLIRWINGDDLSEPVVEVIKNPLVPVLVSSVSIYEIEMKMSLGKLQMPEGYIPFLKEKGFTFLSLTAAHSQTAARYPWHHRDPFDRLLVAQAACENAIFVTTDRHLALYNVPILAS